MNEPRTPGLAPRWHTALLVALIVTVTVTGLVAGRGETAPGPRISTVYLPTLVVEWALVVYVCRVGRPRSVLGELLGRPWDTFLRASGDLAIAVSFFLLVHAVESPWLHASASHRAALAAVLPATNTERFIWVLVAASVGFAEEVVYRGYLLGQLSAITGSAMAGVVLQAALFGLAHADQGAFALVRVALYGIGFALVALVRKSLFPGIAAHVAIDVVSGFSIH